MNLNLLKKATSFFLVFVAGCLFGAYQNFWAAYELGYQSTRKVFAFNPNGILEYAVLKDEYHTPIDKSVLADVLYQINWGYLQIGIFLLIAFGLAALIWPRDQK